MWSAADDFPCEYTFSSSDVLLLDGSPQDGMGCIAPALVMALPTFLGEFEYDNREEPLPAASSSRQQVEHSPHTKHQSGKKCRSGNKQQSDNKCQWVQSEQVLNIDIIFEECSEHGQNGVHCSGCSVFLA
ncbi:hypothetical protein NEOLEDRAFT_1152290 [Neolentinus lepideus HHB14362 ss-1]|uniref:Uncharacterized protein n=1 Tax=Neolentinus lepideus HHB14362 ss-1 TaxID=1314782 RepID=A0A165MX87_9AGAM|nr:hypothetical protein NEOLEDRAFT_1152290 [Neolentinus lepideus HHB14362 ss-1]